MTREERLAQIKKEREERKARESRLQEIKSARAAEKESPATLSKPPLGSMSDKKHTAGNLADTDSGLSTREHYVIDPLGFLGGRSEFDPTSLLRGELTSVGAKFEHQVAEKELEQTKKNAATFVTKPGTVSAGIQESRPLISKNESVEQAKANRDAAAQNYYDLAGRDSVRDIMASGQSVTFQKAVELGTQIEELSDALKYVSGENATDLIAERGALLREQESYLEALGKGGFDADRAVGYEVQQMRARDAAKQNADTQRWADEHPVLATIGSIATSPVQGLDYLHAVAGNLGHNGTKDIENYTPLSGADFQVTNTTQALREGASSDLGNVGKFLYNTGMSMADSALLVSALGPGATVVMGMSAASSTAKDVVDRGGTNNQALLAGFAAGVAEAAFEKFSVDNLISMSSAKNAKAFFGNLLKQAGIEATEEINTELANILMDSAIMGQNSNFNVAVQDYMAQGMTEEQAKQQAFMDNLKQVALAGLGGFLSGGGMASVKMGGMKLVDSALNRNTDTEGAQLLQNALDIKENGTPAQQNINEIDTAPAGVEQNINEPTHLSNSQVDRMIRDQGEMARLGIDTNGKTMSQLRGEVRAALAAQEQGAQESSSSGNIQMPAQETALTGNSVANEAETRRRMTADEVATAVLGENGAKAFRTVYNSDVASRVDEQTATTGFNTVYKAKLDGRTLTAEEQNQTASLPQELRMAAESSAQLDRQRASQAKYFGENSGLVRDDSFKKAHLSYKTTTTLDAVAKAAGVQVRFVDKVADGAANASYNNGVIEIALDSKDPVMTAFTHEVVHRIRETSPQSYTAMAEFVQKYIGTNANKKLSERYSSKYGTTDVSYYTEEMVADAFGTILRDGEAMSQFVKDDRNAFQKMLDAIRDLINAVKRALNGQNVELSRDQKTAFMALQSKLTEMEETLVKALESVSQSAEKNTATNGGEVKFSRKEDVLALSNVDWMDNFSSIKEQLAKHADELNEMQPVAVVEYNPKSTTKLSKTISDEVAKIGGQTMKRGVVTFDFDAKGVNSILTHAKSYELQAASLASPYVAKYGRLIAGQKNHENGGLTTLTYAAPVVINGTTVNVGVAIQFHKNGRPRAVNVGLQSGGTFKMDMTKAPKGLDSRVNRYGQGTALPTEGAFKQSVAQPITTVNPEVDESGDNERASLKAKDGDFAEAAKAAIKDAQLAGMMNQGRKDAEKLRKAKEKTTEVRQKRDETIKALKEHQRGREAAMRESRNASAIRAKIQRHVAELSRRLRNPTDKKHVPEALRAPVAKLLESINLESRDGAPTKRTQAFNELKKVYAEIAENLVIDPDLLGGEGTTGLLDDVIAMADKRIADMNTEELDTIWKAIRAIEASIRTANKAFSAGRFQTIQEAAEALRSDNLFKRSKTEWNHIEKLQKLTSVDMLTPEAYFHRLGKAGDAIFRMMRNAQDKHIRLMKQVADFTNENLSDVDVRKLEKEMHTVTLGGQDVEMSTAQIMELYALMRRQQALEHLVEGGILPDVVSKKGLKKAAKAEPIYGVTADELMEAVGVLTEEQVQIAEMLQEYASTTLSDFGNEASMEVYGYRKFTEPHYWPIRSNRQEVKSDIQKETQVTSVANRGFTKNVKPHADNSVMVGSIFDTFASHSSDMATYAAWLGASEDVNRIRNFVFRAASDDGKLHTVETVKGILDRVHGAPSQGEKIGKGQQYLQKLLADIANGVKGVDASASLTGGLLGNYKAASVGGNLRVVIQQPTAILRAFDMVDPKYFLPAMKPNHGFEKAKKYAPIAQWKDWGYFDIHTGRQMKDVLFNSASALDKTREASMWLAGKMDSVSWGMLWNAIEAETKDKTDLNPGTEAFYQKVAERFNEVIDRTQVVDGILQRSQIMRDPGDLKKMVTAFMGEPTKQYNMLLSAAYDAKNGVYGGKRALVRTGITLATAAVMNAAAQSIIDAFRDDDREQDYWEKWLEAFVGVGADEKTAAMRYLNSNVGSAFNPLGYLPYAKDVWSLIQGYDVSRMDMDSIDKTLSAGTNLMKALRGEGKATIGGATITMLAELSKMAGVPVANLKREVTSFALTAAMESDSYLMEYRIRKVLYKVPENTTMYYDILYSAMQNDPEAYETIYADMVKSGLTEDKVKKGMETRMKSAQGVNSVSDLEQRWMSPEQKGAYDTYLRRMEKSAVWGKAKADQRSAAEDLLYDYVTGGADKMEEKLEDGIRYGVDETEYMLYKLALSMADNPTDTGKYGTYTNEEVKAAIDMLGLGKKESAWLWEAQGRSEKSNPYK